MELDHFVKKEKKNKKKSRKHIWKNSKDKKKKKKLKIDLDVGQPPPSKGINGQGTYLWGQCIPRLEKRIRKLSH